MTDVNLRDKWHSGLQFMKKEMEMILLTGSVSSSSNGRSNLSKQCPEMGQTKSPLDGSKTLSRHVSSQAGKKNHILQRRILKVKEKLDKQFCGKD